jgi:hypothetical protein
MDLNQRASRGTLEGSLALHPTYCSWINELWFGKIERDVIARGVFTSVFTLKRKLMRYIRRYNKALKTAKWKYADPSRHITQSGTGH